MIRILLLALCLSSVSLLNAQIGLRAGYHFNDATDWTIISETNPNNDTELLGDGFSIGVDYWFRLKNLRIEFFPELNYSSYQATTVLENDFSAQNFNFFFNTHIYLFDIGSDCECPTWSKDAQVLQKGLFLLVSPGVSFWGLDIDSNGTALSDNATAFSIAGGLGFDIGFSDFLTVTPFAGYRYFPSVEWESLDPEKTPDLSIGVEESESSIGQIFAGIRIGLRFSS